MSSVLEAQNSLIQAHFGQKEGIEPVLDPLESEDHTPIDKDICRRVSLFIAACWPPSLPRVDVRAWRRVILSSSKFTSIPIPRVIRRVWSGFRPFCFKAFQAAKGILQWSVPAIFFASGTSSENFIGGSLLSSIIQYMIYLSSMKKRGQWIKETPPSRPCE